MMITNSHLLKRISSVMLLVCFCSCEDTDVQIPTTVTDVDGNVYKTVVIGNQRWFAENLRVAHFPTGEPILAADVSSELKANTPYYYHFGDKPANSTGIGLLYNYSGATANENPNPLQDGSIGGRDLRGSCPSGWHIPSLEEWDELINYLNKQEDAGGKLKAMYSWKSPNDGATNESGFTAMPTGAFDKFNGGYSEQFETTFYWSTTGGDYKRGMHLQFDSATASTLWSAHRSQAAAVRCLKD